jgi:xylan 1,4-beta-xylosidase
MSATPPTLFRAIGNACSDPGRAILSLRDSYRRDLHTVKGATGFEYIRFHAILDDVVGWYDEKERA